MPTPAREVVLAAITSQLQTQFPALVVERARRSPVDTRADTLPLAVITGTDWTPDDTQEQTYTHYTMGFNVTTTVTAADDMALELEQSVWHANVVGALVGYTPAIDGVLDVVEGETEFLPVDDDDGSKPAAEVSTNFTIVVILPRGQLYLP